MMPDNNKILLDSSSNDSCITITESTDNNENSYDEFFDDEKCRKPKGKKIKHFTRKNARD